jgi:NTE family protein
MEVSPTLRSQEIRLEEPRQDIRRAIVLSGGGARGAYEAGVLHYIFQDLPAKLGFVPRFQVYSGTSVGAVHCCYLAAHAHRIEAGVRGLVDLWKNMSFSTVYRFGASDAFDFSRNLLASLLGRSVATEDHPDRIHGLLNTTPLEQLVVRQIPWRHLRRNLRSKVLDALCVSATEIATGRTVTFVDNRERRVESWTRDPMFVARPVRVGPDHALASAAIPVLFPAVRIRDTYFCDGSLRLNSPLSPALRLGCNRILAIGLRRESVPSPHESLRESRIGKFHSAGFMFGKILNTVLLDRLEHDIVQMRLLNRLMRTGLSVSGQKYIEEMNRGLAIERGLGFRIVDDCFIRPSEDIGMLAAQYVHQMRDKPSNTWIGRLAFRTLTRGAPEGEADLMSYLLFDRDYASSLISLGMADAARAEDELIRFFSS